MRHALSLSVAGITVVSMVAGCSPFHNMAVVTSVASVVGTAASSVCVHAINPPKDESPDQNYCFVDDGPNIDRGLRVGDCVRLTEQKESLRVSGARKIPCPEPSTSTSHG